MVKALPRQLELGRNRHLWAGEVMSGIGVSGSAEAQGSPAGRSIAFASVLLLGLCPPGLFAADLLLTATGTISTVSSGLEPAFKVGQRVTYQLVYDPDSPSTYARKSFSIYLDAIRSFSVSVASFGAVSPAGEIRVANNIEDAGDVFIVEASFEDGLTGPVVGRFPLTRISFQLWDIEATAWDSHSLPLAFLPAASFDNRVFSMDFVDSNSTYIVTGLLESITVAEVPSGAVSGDDAARK